MGSIVSREPYNQKRTQTPSQSIFRLLSMIICKSYVVTMRVLIGYYITYIKDILIEPSRDLMNRKNMH